MRDGPFYAQFMAFLKGSSLSLKTSARREAARVEFATKTDLDELMDRFLIKVLIGNGVLIAAAVMVRHYLRG